MSQAQAREIVVAFNDKLLRQFAADEELSQFLSKNPAEYDYFLTKESAAGATKSSLAALAIHDIFIAFQELIDKCTSTWNPLHLAHAKRIADFIKNKALPSLKGDFITSPQKAPAVLQLQIPPEILKQRFGLFAAVVAVLQEFISTPCEAVPAENLKQYGVFAYLGDMVCSSLCPWYIDEVSARIQEQSAALVMDEVRSHILEKVSHITDSDQNTLKQAPIQLQRIQERLANPVSKPESFNELLRLADALQQSVTAMKQAYTPQDKSGKDSPRLMQLVQEIQAGRVAIGRLIGATDNQAGDIATVLAALQADPVDFEALIVFLQPHFSPELYRQIVDLFQDDFTRARSQLDFFTQVHAVLAELKTHLEQQLLLINTLKPVFTELATRPLKNRSGDECQALLHFIQTQKEALQELVLSEDMKALCTTQLGSLEQIQAEVNAFQKGGQKVIVAKQIADKEQRLSDYAAAAEQAEDDKREKNSRADAIQVQLLEIRKQLKAIAEQSGEDIIERRASLFERKETLAIERRQVLLEVRELEQKISEDREIINRLESERDDLRAQLELLTECESAAEATQQLQALATAVSEQRGKIAEITELTSIDQAIIQHRDFQEDFQALHSAVAANKLAAIESVDPSNSVLEPARKIADEARETLRKYLLEIYQRGSALVIAQKTAILEQKEACLQNRAFVTDVKSNFSIHAKGTQFEIGVREANKVKPLARKMREMRIPQGQDLKSDSSVKIVEALIAYIQSLRIALQKLKDDDVACGQQSQRFTKELITLQGREYTQSQNDESQQNEQQVSQSYQSQLDELQRLEQFFSEVMLPRLKRAETCAQQLEIYLSKNHRALVFHWYDIVLLPLLFQAIVNWFKNSDNRARRNYVEKTLMPAIADFTQQAESDGTQLQSIINQGLTQFKPRADHKESFQACLLQIRENLRIDNSLSPPDKSAFELLKSKIETISRTTGWGIKPTFWRSCSEIKIASPAENGHSTINTICPPEIKTIYEKSTQAANNNDLTNQNQLELLQQFHAMLLAQLTCSSLWLGSWAGWTLQTKAHVADVDQVLAPTVRSSISS